MRDFFSKCTIYVGVTYKQSENMWQAAIYKNKKNRFLGRYKTKQRYKTRKQ